jgi:hypothetical protein
MAYIKTVTLHPDWLPPSELGVGPFVLSARFQLKNGGVSKTYSVEVRRENFGKPIAFIVSEKELGPFPVELYMEQFGPVPLRVPLKAAK